MNKIKLVDVFYNSVTDLGFKPRRCNEYHVQVMTVHNFYPTTSRYYNSLTGETKNYTNDILFDKEEFKRFLNN